MADENVVIMRGHMTRDPELKTLSSGKSLCNFGIAVNAGGRGAKACFLECVAWEKVAEIIADNLGKGDPIYVRGFLMYESWEGKSGKTSRHKLSVQVFNSPGGDTRNYEDRDDDSGSGDDIDEDAVPF